MEILVKSFNRPYYLERCLRSLQMQVHGDYTVKILDDGTPEKYLQKIAALFPEVQIIRSPLYAQKAAAIEAAASDRKPFDAFSIPADFWVNQVRQTTPLFFLFEDDFWLTRPMSFPEVTALMQTEDLLLLKTYWRQNTQLMKGAKRTVGSGVEVYQPKVPFYVDFLVHNRLKLQSILARLRIFKVTNPFRISLYDLYSVASAFYRKDYWLYLWETAAQGKVNETLQLLQASNWWKARKGGGYARFAEDVSNTSYITSATNTYESVNLDIFRFNHLLNEAWLRGNLEAMAGYPGDLPEASIEVVLEQAGDPKATVAAWRQWVALFRGQYESFGYNVY